MDFDPSLALIPPRAASESSDDADRERRIIPEDDNPSGKNDRRVKKIYRGIAKTCSKINWQAIADQRNSVDKYNSQ